MLGAGYPILDVALSTFCIALVIVWIILVWHVYRDVVGSPDLSGPTKAWWALIIVVLPLVGCLVYLFARGGSKHERHVPDVHASQESFEDYIRRIASTKE